MEPFGTQKQTGRHTIEFIMIVGVSQEGKALTHNVLHLVVTVRVPVMFVLSMDKYISSGNADRLPHSAGSVPDNMGSCSCKVVRAWKPLLPHSTGNVPDSVGNCSSKSVRAGKPLLPHNAGSVPTIGKSNSHSCESSGNAPASAQDSGSVPAISG